MKYLITVISAILLTIALPSFANCPDGACENDNERPERPKRGERGEQGGDQQNNDRGKRGERGGPKQPGRGGMAQMILKNKKLAEKLELTEEQINIFQKCADKSKESMEKLMEKMKTVSKKQAELISAEEIDEEAVMKIVTKLGDLKTKMAKVQVSQIIKIQKTLTSEQRKKLQEMRQRRENRGSGKDGRDEMSEEERAERREERKKRNEDSREDEMRRRKKEE